MTRIAAITPAHREHLRQLKADFDRAYDNIENVLDRASSGYKRAEVLYRTWIKAIDARALALLDDLDALEIGGGGLRPAEPAIAPYSPVSPAPVGQVDDIFAEMENLLHARDLIGDMDAEFVNQW